MDISDKFLYILSSYGEFSKRKFYNLYDKVYSTANNKDKSIQKSNQNDTSAQNLEKVIQRRTLDLLIAMGHIDFSYKKNSGFVLPLRLTEIKQIHRKGIAFHLVGSRDDKIIDAMNKYLRENLNNQIDKQKQNLYYPLLANTLQITFTTYEEVLAFIKKFPAVSLDLEEFHFELGNKSSIFDFANKLNNWEEVKLKSGWELSVFNRKYFRFQKTQVGNFSKHLDLIYLQDPLTRMVKFYLIKKEEMHDVTKWISWAKYLFLHYDGKKIKILFYDNCCKHLFVPTSLGLPLQIEKLLVHQSGSASLCVLNEKGYDLRFNKYENILPPYALIISNMLGLSLSILKINFPRSEFKQFDFR